MNIAEAINQIKAVFKTYAKKGLIQKDWLKNADKGKVYELYCLSQVVRELSTSFGYTLVFKGKNVEFQSKPGHVHMHKPHFELHYGGVHKFNLFTDIEFQTFGASQNTVSDLSDYHELDLAVIDVQVTKGTPKYSQIALGVECKSHENFGKDIVKNVLGVRRELSLLKDPRPSRISNGASKNPPSLVPADPASEFWLAFSDPNGLKYSNSPSTFGITFQHWQP